jgi:para-aminobenzoate synthetase component 1
MNLPLVEEVAWPGSAFEALLRLRRRPGAFLLESGGTDERLARWSFAGADPFLHLEGKGREVVIESEGRRRPERGSVFSLLRGLLSRFKVGRAPGAPPLLGGAVGYFGYDLRHLLERLPAAAAEDVPIPDCRLGFYDTVLALDHARRQAFLCSTGRPETDPGGARRRAKARLAEFRELVCRPASAPPVRRREVDFEVRANFTRERYLEAIGRAKEYIAAGDIYQVNLSQRFSAPLATSPLSLYARLRETNPAPFAAFLEAPEFVVVSASPERFLQLRSGKVETRPIKGTRPRGKTPEEDQRLAEELVRSVKDRAENVMIVDLERNDLGKVCDYGSIRAEDLFRLEKYPTVFHLVSTVVGKLHRGRTAVDLLKACFPGGSITGAPKVRAMEIIDELEPTRRGVYTGAIGYLSFCGDMDLNIVIRTLLVKDGVAHLQAGGGIVADSDPELEYQETLDKARALVEALRAEARAA